MAVSGLPDAVAVTAGEFEGCAVLSGGDVDCWGTDGDILGANPVVVSGVSNAITAGEGGSIGGCAVVSGGSVECWGDDLPPVATPLSGVSDAVAVSVGRVDDDGCVVLSDGGVDCWGEDGSGQLGNGTRPNFSSMPVAVSGISTAVAVGVGYEYACALLSDGTVECWGFNAGGELGTPTKAPGIESDVPVSVTGITDATAIGVGEETACAVLSDGKVQCWGDNADGELGDGTSTGPEECGFACSRTPVTVSGLNTAVGISAGYRKACAVLSVGNVECWGFNQFGQLGNGTTTNSDVPVLAGPLVSAAPASLPPAPSSPSPGATSGTLTTGASTPQPIQSTAHGHAATQPPLTAAAVFDLPPAKQCVSKRRFTIHVRSYVGITWISASIKINHKRVKTVGKTHIKALISLVGLPKGTFVLSITANASNGQSVTGKRTYHTCVPKSKSSYRAPRL